MKFTLAIVALIGVTSAIRITADPAKPSDDDVAAAAAAKGDVKPADPLNPGKGPVDEALKTDDKKSEEAAAAAGKPIDTSNAPVAADAPKSDGKPEPLSDAEKMRNHILRVASVG